MLDSLLRRRECQTALVCSGQHDGLGFALTKETGLAVLDIEDCIDAGVALQNGRSEKWMPWTASPRSAHPARDYTFFAGEPSRPTSTARRSTVSCGTATRCSASLG